MVTTADITNARRRLQQWGKLALVGVSLFLFIVAIFLMKDGARALGPLVEDHFAIGNFADALGFGWLMSYVVMSGSPVAATGLTLLDGDVVDRLGAYAIVVGSRLGASMIVLGIGFFYMVRGRSRARSLSMGLLSLAVVGSIQIPAIVVGILLLQFGTVDGLQFQFGRTIIEPVKLILDPVARTLALYLPDWGIFVVGLGVMLVSLNLFDFSVSETVSNARETDNVHRFIYRPWVMFLLGSLVTLVSMSVSISLGILVPLHQRGIARREHMIPYIMGANISTFVDTLLAAVLLENRVSFTVVIAEIISLLLISALVLLLVYRPYKEAVLRFVDWNVTDRRNLTIFLTTIFVIPLLLLLL